MSSVDVGTAFVRVVPDTTQFRALLQAQVSAAVASVSVPGVAAGGIAGAAGAAATSTAALATASNAAAGSSARQAKAALAVTRALETQRLAENALSAAIKSKASASQIETLTNRASIATAATQAATLQKNAVATSINTAASEAATKAALAQQATAIKSAAAAAAKQSSTEAAAASTARLAAASNIAAGSDVKQAQAALAVTRALEVQRVAEDALTAAIARNASAAQIQNLTGRVQVTTSAAQVASLRQAELLANAGTAGNKAAKGLANAGTQSKILQGSLIGLSRITPVAVFGLGLYGSAAIGLGLAIKGAVGSAADFESQLNTFQSVTGVSAEQLERVRQAAIDLGADTSLAAISAGDAAVALTELAKAGISVNDALAASRGVLELAGAASLSAADAAKIVATQLNAFELAGTEAIKVADLLASASIAAQGEIADFGASFQQVAAVANQSGVSVERTTALLTQLARSGIQGADAGTSLRTTLLRLIPTTKEAAEFVEALGINIDKSRTLGEQLPEVIEQYRNALSALEPTQATFVLNQILGQDAIRAGSIIFDQEVGALERQERALGDSGVAAQLNAAKQKGLKGAFAGLQSQIETAGIELGRLVDGPLEAFIRDISGAIGGVSDFVKALGNLGEVTIPIINIPIKLDFGGDDAFSKAVKKGLSVSLSDVVGEAIPDKEKLFGAVDFDLAEGGIAETNDQFGFGGLVSDLEDKRQKEFDRTFGAAARRNKDFRKNIQKKVSELQEDKEAKKITLEIPIRLQQAVIDAQLENDLQREKIADQAIVDFLERKLQGITEGTKKFLAVSEQLRDAKEKRDAAAAAFSLPTNLSISSIRAESTKSLQDNLTADRAIVDAYRKELASTKTTGSELDSLRVDLANAEAKVAGDVRAIKDEAKANREKVMAEQEKAATEASNAREASLRFLAEQAGNQGGAEKRLIDFLRKRVSDAKGNVAEFSAAKTELDTERVKFSAAVVAAAKSDIDLRNARLETKLQAAGLTPQIADNLKVYNLQLKLFTQDRENAERLAAAAKGNKAKQQALLLEVESLKQKIIGVNASIKGLNGEGQGGFTLQQLFQEAADEFSQFGSNIASRGGILSPQDARGAFSASVLAGKDATIGIQSATLTQAEKQTQLLEGIYARLGLSPTAGQASRVSETGSRGSFASIGEAMWIRRGFE